MDKVCREWTIPLAAESTAIAQSHWYNARVQASQNDSLDTAISHLPALDGLRGVAILLVLALHFGVAADFALRAPGALTRWIERICYAGWSGVDLFFVLSGFLITSILLATKEQAGYFRRFYARRALRIFPLYYTALVLAFFVVPGVFRDRASDLVSNGAGTQAWFWTYTANIGMVLGTANAALLAHFWTLAIEEQYYVFWPSVVKLTSRRGLIAVSLLLIVGALTLRFYAVSTTLGWPWAYRFTLARVDGFGVGALVALLASDSRSRDRLLRMAPYGLAATLAALAVMFLLVPRFYPTDSTVVTMGQSLLAIASGWLIATALRPRGSGWFCSPALRWLGKYSYGIYVWHWPLQRLLLILFAARWPPVQGSFLAGLAFAALGVVGSCGLGWTSYVVLERRFLLLKRLVAYAPSASEKPAAAI
jgi:peptidoglycan/LPS O-acetylase OafA/YrhL